MAKLSVKNLLGTQNLTLEDLHLIYETADNFKEVNRMSPQFLHAKTARSSPAWRGLRLFIVIPGWPR